MKMIEFVFYSGIAVSFFITFLMWKTDRSYTKMIKEIEKEIEKQITEKNQKQNEQ